MSQEKKKKIKKVKQIKKPLKVKPAVVPKSTRKIKTAKSKLPITSYGEKKLRKRNIVFSILFGLITIALIVVNATILSKMNPENMSNNDYLLFTLIRSALYFLIGLFIYITLLSFETYKAKFHPKPLRILLTILPASIFFALSFLSIGLRILISLAAVIPFVPFTLFKYHTRHNVWRIIFVTSTIITLLMSFFGSYLHGVYYRDSINGAEPDKNKIDTSFLSSPFIINLPVDISSFMDLLDQLGNLDDLTLESSVANISALNGQLGNYLYRWDVYDQYHLNDKGNWEFTRSNDALLYNIPSDNFAQPSDFNSATDTKMSIQQTVYTASSAINIGLLSTWRSANKPYIESQSNWGASIYDLNGSQVGSSDATVQYDQGDQFRLKATVSKDNPLTPFRGTFAFDTYFMKEDDAENLMKNTIKYSSLDSSYMQDHYSLFLQAPEGYYTTTSPDVRHFADDEIGANIAPDTDVYTVITSVIQNVLSKGNVENIFGGSNTDTGGEDPANVLARDQPAPASAYIALTVMTLRRLGIPVRPVMGFAVGSGDSQKRELKLGNLYYWIEALLPLDTNNDGSADEYKWGQFQIGPYPVSEGNYVYCDNSLNAQYNVSLEMFENRPGDIATMSVGSSSAYLIDYGVSYNIAVHVTRNSQPVPNTPVVLKTYTTSEIKSGASTSLLSGGKALSSQPISSNASGIAVLKYTFTADNYSVLDFSNEEGTSYVLVAMNGLTNIDAKAFAIFPRGYLSSVKINASAQTIPNPQNPTESQNYYLIQQGWRYELSSVLYKSGPPGTDPLSNRVVTYYLLTPTQLQAIQGGAAIDPSQFTKIGEVKTDASGNSSVSSVNSTTHTDYFTGLQVNTTYAVIAVYGMNYSFAPIVIIDGLSATINLNTTTLDTGTDGATKWEHIVATFTMQPPNGASEPVKNTSVDLWMVYDTDWKAYDGSVSGSSYNSTLSSSTRSKYIGNFRTDNNGQVIHDYLLNVSVLGAGKFKVVAIYSDRWVGSENVYVITPPALLAGNQHTEDQTIYSKFLKENSFIEFSKNVITKVNKNTLFVPLFILFAIINKKMKEKGSISLQEYKTTLKTKKSCSSYSYSIDGWFNE